MRCWRAIRQQATTAQKGKKGDKERGEKKKVSSASRDTLPLHLAADRGCFRVDERIREGEGGEGEKKGGKKKRQISGEQYSGSSPTPIKAVMFSIHTQPPKGCGLVQRERKPEEGEGKREKERKRERFFESSKSLGCLERFTNPKPLGGCVVKEGEKERKGEKKERA